MKGIILITLLLTTPGLFAQQNDLTKSNLKGNVKSVRTIRYKAIQKKKKVKLGPILPMMNFQIFYNTQGNDSAICRYRFLDEVHILTDSTFYEYGNNRKLRGLNYNVKGQYGYSKFNYEDDQLVSRIYYDLNDSITQSWHYRRFDNDQIEITEKFKYDSSSYSVHLYHTNGSRIKSEYYRNSEIWYTRIFNIDKNRVETSWIYVSNGLESEYECEYEFDENGNWIKKTEFLGGKAVYITLRTIQYFEK